MEPTIWLSVFKTYRLAPYLLASTAAFYLSELFALQTHPWALPRCLQALKNAAYEADLEGFRTTL